jgi:hypothetical protein
MQRTRHDLSALSQDRYTRRQEVVDESLWRSLAWDFGSEPRRLSLPISRFPQSVHILVSNVLTMPRWRVSRLR